MEKQYLKDWIDSDKKLQDLIVEIESTGKSNNEKAELAFEKLSTLYNIPRMPIDVNEGFEFKSKNPLKEIIDKRSLFEEHTLIKYLSKENEDPRGMVLLATWHLLNDYRVDLWQIAEKEFGGNIPDRCQIGIRGSGIYGEVVFPNKEGKSWSELGCLKNNLLIE
ncbi:hypothetical protein HN014_10665 [Aquimarina sp. TRL1]|uniref:hypothetical protein n=1 Tax=Aquimarina sp. (strain TRL1) TaxID=2736252 RepID=UPI00158BCAB3|nr:hypothetical protein [Aquimarina sp. TRL1]QKX05357.1 hypothetical protein HN014_10665 [Aquimarina sp. TRL1]